MNDELFQPEEVGLDSPKVKWMKANAIKVTENEQYNAKIFLAFSIANPLLQTGYGADEDDAIVAFAKRNGLKLWNES